MGVQLTHASFFSGAGGTDLGLEAAGWRTVSFSEIDSYASGVLERIWPDTPNLGCIRSVAWGVPVNPYHAHDDKGRCLDAVRVKGEPDGRQLTPADEWPGVESGPPGTRAERGVSSGGADPAGSGDRVPHGSLGGAEAQLGGGRSDTEPPGDGRDLWRTATLWSGGFPCQDLSVAGKRAGFGGHRSVLAFAFLDLVERYRPPAILLENVPGLLSSNRGRDFDALRRRLGELGYGVAYRVLDAQHFGVPQRRRRVFILGLRSGPDDPTGRAAAERAATVLSVGARCDRHPATGHQAGAGAADGLGGGVRNALSVGGHAGLQPNGQDAHEGELLVAGVAGSLKSRDSKAGIDADGAAGGKLVLARTVHTTIGKRTGPAGDEGAFLITDSVPHGGLRGVGGGPDGGAPSLGREAVEPGERGDYAAGSPSTDASGVRAADGLAGRSHDRAGLERAQAVEAWQGHGSNVGPMGALRAGNGNEGGGVPFVAAPLEGSVARPRGDGSSENLVAAPLEASDGHHGHGSPRGDGHDNLVVADGGSTQAFVVQPEWGQGTDLTAQEVTVAPALTSADPARTDRGVHVFRKATKAHDPEDSERWEDADDDVADALDTGQSARTSTVVAAPLLGTTPGGSQRTTDLNTPVILAPTLTSPTVSEGGRRDTVPIAVVPIASRALSGDGDEAEDGPGGTAKHLTPGLKIGQPGDPAYTVTGGSSDAVGPMPMATVEDDPLLPDGLDSHRYRCCGNGVVAPVAEWLGQLIRAELVGQ